MSALIEKKTTYINVLLDEKGNTVITPKQQKFINSFQSELITEECPACDGDGVVGGDYCDICKSKGKFSYYTELKIVPLTAEKLLQIELSTLTGDALKKLKDKQKIKDFENSDWKNIPKEIQAISVDSRGKVSYYSNVSGIYRKYDDEHSTNCDHVGGQYWHYGTSLPGLDVTEKYKDLKYFFKDKLYFRPKMKKTILDFKKPFDLRHFPTACTKLFVTVSKTKAEKTIVVGSNCMYLRKDNVVWGYGGRNNGDRDFDLMILHSRIKECSQMNFDIQNIPNKTTVFEIPKNRKQKIAINDLKKLDVEKCNEINRNGFAKSIQ